MPTVIRESQNVLILASYYYEELEKHKYEQRIIEVEI